MSMMRPTRFPTVLLLLAFAVGAGPLLGGCREPGPAEEAGRSIDQAVEDVREGIDDLGDDAEEWLDEQRDDD